MKGVPQDLLIVLFLLALAIFQIFRNWRRQRQRSLPQPARVEVDPEDAKEPAWTRARTARNVYALPEGSSAHFGRSEAPGASGPRPSNRFSRHSLMGSRRDLRKAIVITAVLGPCRADEPHEIRS